MLTSPKAKKVAQRRKNMLNDKEDDVLMADFEPECDDADDAGGGQKR